MLCETVTCVPASLITKSVQICLFRVNSLIDHSTTLIGHTSIELYAYQNTLIKESLVWLTCRYNN